MKIEDSGFSYLNGELHCEGVALSRIAGEVGTPSYVYSKAGLLNRIRRLQKALVPTNDTDPQCRIFFAVKACSNIHLLSEMEKAGCGADIVSAGELFRASAAGIAPERVVFSGVGKTAHEIEEALKARIHMFNVESVAELVMLNDIAAKLGARAPVSFRVNPDVDAKTHPHISTGLKRNKFGLSSVELKEIYRRLPACSALEPRGLSCHIGSQITSPRPFVQAWNELLEAAENAPFQVTALDLGGGLGISYGKEKELSLESYGRLIRKTFAGVKYELSIEPGRSLIGPTAVLLSRLVSVKKRGTRYFYIVDSAMNDLIRPALYGAIHPLLPVNGPRTRRRIKADVVGPVCESADTFELSSTLPELDPGALLAFTNSGAYGMTMSSQYNSRPRAAEVLVDGTTYKVIRSRETYADLIQRELV